MHCFVVLRVLYPCPHATSVVPPVAALQPTPQTLEAERESEMAAELRRPVFGPGDVIELRLSVPENKRRVTVFKGICIARRNRSVRTTFTLRNIYGASGGIERTFPL